MGGYFLVTHFFLKNIKKYLQRFTKSIIFALEKQIIMDLKNQTQKRTIKFRIFNKKIKSYIDIHSSAIMIDELNDLNDNLIVEQFTGLHDKNGKEIYEGDILKVCNGSINGIEWLEKPYEVKFICGRFDICLFMWDKEGNNQMDSTHYCEVIGNIYDNPDLLNI